MFDSVELLASFYLPAKIFTKLYIYPQFSLFYAEDYSLLYIIIFYHCLVLFPLKMPVWKILFTFFIVLTTKNIELGFQILFWTESIDQAICSCYIASAHYFLVGLKDKQWTYRHLLFSCILGHDLFSSHVYARNLYLLFPFCSFKSIIPQGKQALFINKEAVLHKENQLLCAGLTSN